MIIVIIITIIINVRHSIRMLLYNVACYYDIT